MKARLLGPCHSSPAGRAEGFRLRMAPRNANGLIAAHWSGLAMLLLAAEATASMEVTITGGADITGQTYTWVVTNGSASPVVAVRIPQYRGSWHRVPDGWSGEVEHPRGEAGLAGTFIATADNQSAGIMTGASAEFQLGIVAEGTPQGFEEVEIEFADGTVALVRAEVPIKEPVTDRNISLLGLGGIFILYLLVRAFKRREQPSDGSPASATSDPTDTNE